MKYTPILLSTLCALFCLNNSYPAGKHKASFKRSINWNWKNIDVEAVSFDKDFMWGAATSGYQQEGAALPDGTMIENNWTEWEKEKELVPAGIATDHFTHWKDDISLMKEAGLKAFRFSILHEKLQPEKDGPFNQEAMDFYVEYCKELKAQGIEPIVTLFHQTWPLWFEELGAFERAENISYWVDFSLYVFKQLHPYVKIWMPLNEPVAYAMSAYYQGTCPPGKKDLQLAGIVTKNLLDAHIAFRKKALEIDPTCTFGIAKVFCPVDPYHWWNPLEHVLAKSSNYLIHDAFINYFNTGYFDWGFPFYGRVTGYNEEAIHALDFIGVNYYENYIINYNTQKVIVPGTLVTDRGKSIYPEGLYRAIVKAHELEVPVYVMENGIAELEDTYRNLFFKQHLYAMYKAMQDGYDVQGYFVWSFTDNFNWNSGFTAKYGLYSIDFDNPALPRSLRPSVHDLVQVMKHGQYH